MIPAAQAMHPVPTVTAHNGAQIPTVAVAAATETPAAVKQSITLESFVLFVANELASVCSHDVVPGSGRGGVVFGPIFGGKGLR